MEENKKTLEDILSNIAEEKLEVKKYFQEI
jgi:hypothetical protein